MTKEVGLQLRGEEWLGGLGLCGGVRVMTSGQSGQTNIFKAGN